MNSTGQSSLEHFLQWNAPLDLCLPFIIINLLLSSTSPFCVVTLLFLRMIEDWKWSPFCCFSQEFWSLNLSHLNPLIPQTKASTTKIRSQSDNVRDSNSLLQLSALQLCAVPWSYLVLYIHTWGLCHPNIL